MNSRGMIGMEHLVPKAAESSALAPNHTSSFSLLRAKSVQDAEDDASISPTTLLSTCLVV